MKSNFWIVLFSLISVGLSAQLSVGVKGSVIRSDFRVTEVSNPNVSSFSFDDGFGYRVGFVARVDIIKVFIQPELLFTEINAQANASNREGKTAQYKFQLHRFDVPIPIGVKLGDFEVFIAPIASFNLNNGASIFSETYRQGGWNLQGGAGYSIGKFNIQLHYEAALSEFAKSAIIEIGDEIYNVPMNVYNSTYGLSLSYTF
ncbi:MAG: PorT family protein [Schleiferiaceae bacterium]|nr:PorT family protein [Schleiferiaceae bacterium]